MVCFKDKEIEMPSLNPSNRILCYYAQTLLYTAFWEEKMKNFPFLHNKFDLAT